LDIVNDNGNNESGVFVN